MNTENIGFIDIIDRRHQQVNFLQNCWWLNWHRLLVILSSFDNFVTKALLLKKYENQIRSMESGLMVPRYYIPGLLTFKSHFILKGKMHYIPNDTLNFMILHLICNIFNCISSLHFIPRELKFISLIVSWHTFYTWCKKPPEKSSPLANDKPQFFFVLQTL